MNQQARNAVWQSMNAQMMMLQGRMAERGIARVSGRYEFSDETTADDLDFVDHDGNFLKIQFGDHKYIDLLPQLGLEVDGAGAEKAVPLPNNPTCCITNAFDVFVEDIVNLVTATDPHMDEKGLSAMAIEIRVEGDFTVELTQPVNEHWNSQDYSGVDPSMVKKVADAGCRIQERRAFEASEHEDLVREVCALEDHAEDETQWVLWKESASDDMLSWDIQLLDIEDLDDIDRYLQVLKHSNDAGSSGPRL